LAGDVRQSGAHGAGTAKTDVLQTLAQGALAQIGAVVAIEHADEHGERRLVPGRAHDGVEPAGAGIGRGPGRAPQLDGHAELACGRQGGAGVGQLVDDDGARFLHGTNDSGPEPSDANAVNNTSRLSLTTAQPAGGILAVGCGAAAAKWSEHTGNGRRFAVS